MASKSSIIFKMTFCFEEQWKQKFPQLCKHDGLCLFHSLPGLSNREALKRVHNGYRMPKAPGTPDPVYEKMVECWGKQPKKRPTFLSLFKFFDEFEWHCHSLQAGGICCQPLVSSCLLSLTPSLPVSLFCMATQAWFLPPDNSFKTVFTTNCTEQPKWLVDITYWRPACRQKLGSLPSVTRNIAMLHMFSGFYSLESLSQRCF